MIISLDGYGKILHEKSVAKKLFTNEFSVGRYHFDGKIGNDYPLLDTKELHFEDEDETYKDTRTGIYRKVNHNDLPSLISSEKDKKSLSFSEVAGTYRNISNPAFLYGDFSTAVWDTFIYLRGLFGKEYHIILVKPNDTEREINLSESTYWGVAAFDGNFLFSSNLRDNLPTAYGYSKSGYGVRFIVRDANGTEMEVAKVDAIYDAGKACAINTEIDLDAITASRLGKSKVLYGSSGYTEDIKAYTIGDMYKEKMIDALLGVIGTYTTHKNIDLGDENFLKVYIEVIASVCIIRDISEDELRFVIESLMDGLGIHNLDLLNFMISLILHEEEKQISEAEKKPPKRYSTSHTLKDYARNKIQVKENIKARQRSIKKPQE